MKKSIVFLSATIVFYGCSFDNTSNNESKDLNEFLLASKQKNYSGKDFFKGIFFLNGEIAQNLDIIKNNYDITKNKSYINNPAEFNRIQDEVILVIEKNNPDFFDVFLKSMQSKNPILITQAIKDSKNELIPALQKLLDSNNIQYDITKYNLQDKNELKNIYEDYTNEIENGKINNASIVLAIALAVVAAVAFYVAVISEYWFPEVIGINSDLYLDELALEISQKY